MRYSEVLLTYAEAAGIALGKPYADQVRARAGLNPLQPSLSDAQYLEAIYNERRHEFAFEMHRWYDLLRHPNSNYFIDDENRLFIHAGFSSLHGPYKEHYSSNYSWDRTLWEMALCMDKRIKKESVLYPKRLKLFSEIYIGHTPTLHYDSFEPMNAVNVWNIDTGAAFNGRLSILEVESKKFWQSDVVQNLYPDETGRNRN
jgi:hypothetical protein